MYQYIFDTHFFIKLKRYNPSFLIRFLVVNECYFFIYNQKNIFMVAKLYIGVYNCIYDIDTGIYTYIQFKKGD